MRSRSNSGVRLDYYQRLVNKCILKHQNPVTGLLPGTPSHPHAWVRDDVYSILAVWGLALAYKKNADLDEDRAKAYELEQSVVKCMRGLLQCMMQQMDKVEKFKYYQMTQHSLHAKYCVRTGKTVVGDNEWGHLQIDATSLYLLILAEMTASGLQIIFTLDEVAFIQNLVFYIQAAYRISDYGIWERGDKTNHGLPELNASSVGMAKAAMEALNELDLFGSRGGPPSVIHCMVDEAQQCQAILQSVLPRESSSKEVDASLLSIISFPAFAVDDPDLIQLTRDTVQNRLQGKYGCRRFLRDGHKTPIEDTHRLHYEPSELKAFENIECQWPLFFCYLVLDGVFTGNKEQVDYYAEALEKVLIKDEHGIKLVPEMYAVPHDKVDAECKNPNSQERMAVGKLPHSWAQSLYVLGRLLVEGFLSPGEIDPLNRRLVAEPKPDLVVQVVILAEDKSIQEKLAYNDLKVQTIAEVAPIQVYPARLLSYIYAQLGRSAKLGLTGRPSDVMGVLTTSKLYALGDQILAFMPQFVDQQEFYLPLDTALLIDMFKTDVQYLHYSWKMLGRPLIVFPIRSSLLDFSSILHPALVATIKKLQTGYINGTRVQLGNLSEFLNTSCVTNLTFLTEAEGAPDVNGWLDTLDRLAISAYSRPRVLSGAGDKRRRRSGGRLSRKSSVRGIIRRTCSIQVEAGEIPDNTSGMSSGSGSSPSGSNPTSPLPGGGVPFPQFSASIMSEPHHPHLRGDKEEGAVIHYNQKQFEGVDCQDLVEQLKDTESLHDQADIIHFLFITKGADWDTEMEDKPGCKVRDLLTELYDKAGQLKQWWLVRHTAGMLRKKVEDLAKAATDILVRQKTLAVGLPPEPREKIITRPLTPDELATVIHDACGEDSSTAMLTQELLVYLAMFIRTEPKLFHEMLRLRVGLIIQVMASELARTLKCSGEEASDQLLNLSPYEMKTLLHHILSGKEFGVRSGLSKYTGEHRLFIESLSPRSATTSRATSRAAASPSVSQFRQELNDSIKTVDQVATLPLDSTAAGQLQDSLDTDRQGQWLRRRRLDGSLNRVPVGFYPDVWKVLERCHGLSISGNVLPTHLTREMTAGELKFALQVEMVLNRIPQPEYRQLMVEAMMVLCLVVNNDNEKVFWHEIIHVDKLVAKANEVFLHEQNSGGGSNTQLTMTAESSIAGVHLEFYDSAPSGRYGTMTYLCKATAQNLHFPSSFDGNLDCVVS